MQSRTEADPELDYDEPQQRGLWRLAAEKSNLHSFRISQEGLSREAKALLGLPVFCNESSIDEQLITDTTAALDEPRLEFLFDKYKYALSRPNCKAIW